MAGKSGWVTNVLNGFHLTHVPSTPARRKTVAKYILGHMGQSRKPPGERASYYQAAAMQYVGKRVVIGPDRVVGTVDCIVVRDIGHRVALGDGKGYVGPFAALVRFDNGYAAEFGLSGVKLLTENPAPMPDCHG